MAPIYQLGEESCISSYIEESVSSTQSVCTWTNFVDLHKPGSHQVGQQDNGEIAS